MARPKAPQPPADYIAGQVGVYLLHFATPYKHARHYVGYTTHLDRRLIEHWYCPRRLMRAVKDAGINWELARFWVGGDRDWETRLHRFGSKAQFCPICNPKSGGGRCYIDRRPALPTPSTQALPF